MERALQVLYLQKNVTTWIFDKDTIRRAQALSHGYFTPDREFALARVDLIICATGNKSIRFDKNRELCDFYKLKNNCFIASVTSADDEFSFGDMRNIHTSIDASVGINTITWDDDRCFHLLNNGNAVNFLHNNTLGPYIYIVACELVTCLNYLLTRPRDKRFFNAVIELTTEDRQMIAKSWIDVFLEKRSDDE